MATLRFVPPAEAEGGQSLLDAGDFTYLGGYNIDLNGLEEGYCQGLALRRVSGDLRFIYHQHDTGNDGPLKEFSLSGKSYGDTINSHTDSWTIGSWATQPDGDVPHTHLKWDNDLGILWAVGSLDYGGQSDPPRDTNIQLLTLGSGAVSAVKRLSVEGIPDRRAYGGMLKIPAALRTYLGITQAEMLGFGGYTSLMSAAGEAAMGSTMIALPSTSGYSHNDEIPASAIQVFANRGITARGHRKWYGGSTIDDDGPWNYNDGADIRGENPSTPPTVLPVLSPSFLTGETSTSSGRTWWNWIDWYRGGEAVFSDTKKGVLLFADLTVGKNFYQSSAVHADRRCFEVHVFDPADLLAVKNATMDADDIQPTNMFRLSEVDRNADVMQAYYTAYDDVDNKLYIYQPSAVSSSVGKLSVYGVSV